MVTVGVRGLGLPCPDQSPSEMALFSQAVHTTSELSAQLDGHETFMPSYIVDSSDVRLFHFCASGRTTDPILVR